MLKQQRQDIEVLGFKEQQFQRSKFVLDIAVKTF